MSESPRLLVEPGRVKLSGSWTLAEMLPRLPALQADLAACPSGIDHWDLSAVTRLDSAAAVLLWRTWGAQWPAALVAGEGGRISAGSSRTSPNPGAFPGNGRRLAAQGGCQSTRHDRLVRPVAA